MQENVHFLSICADCVHFYVLLRFILALLNHVFFVFVTELSRSMGQHSSVAQSGTTV